MRIEINGRFPVQTQARRGLNGDSLFAAEIGAAGAEDTTPSAYLCALGAWKVERERIVSLWGEGVANGVVRFAMRLLGRL